MFNNHLIVKYFIGGNNIPHRLKNNVNSMMDRFQKKHSHFFFFFDPDDLKLLAVYEMIKNGNTFQLYSLWFNDNVRSSYIKTRYEWYTKRILRQSNPGATVVF